MIKVQRVRLPGSNQVTWLVIGDDYLPIQPIQSYLSYLEGLERSPNTIHAYANHLKLFWEFLQDSRLDWKEVTIQHLSNFIHWLRSPNPRVVFIEQQKPKRSEKTINTILTIICAFYEFQERIGKVKGINAYQDVPTIKRRYKPLLYHISKGSFTKKRLLKIKEKRLLPKTLTVKQVGQLINACNRVRDKFLICLLYESGIRIGEALGLRHSDLVSEGKNEVHVVPRQDNYNQARAKSGVGRIVHVSKELMQIYSNYLVEEYPIDIDSDYVFVNIWDGKLGTPMNYSGVESLFRRLSKKTGIDVHPHLLRHTHATELVRDGWEMAYVQKRLGHADVQTTINTYVHLTSDDMKEAYEKYLVEKRNKSNV
jgi:integrase